MVIADAEGIDAVTIRKIAEALTVTPMALYWHFETKDELIGGMGDRVLDEMDVAFFASDASAYVTAQVLVVDGGLVRM